MWLFTHLPAEEKVTAGMMGLSVWRPPEGYRMETVRLPASTMEALMSKGEKSDWAVLQLHGGAFVSGVNDLYRMMAVRYSSLAGGACVYTLNYRLWPQYPYPSQQNDAMDAWVYLTGTAGYAADPVSYTHLRAHETGRKLVCRLLLEKKKKNKNGWNQE